MNVIIPLLAVIIWSVNAIVSKISASAIDPAAISFYRWFLALLTLTPFVLAGVIHNWRAIREYWWKLMILGLLGMVLNQSLYYYAAHSISALFISIFNSLIPLLTVLISIMLSWVIPSVGIVLGSMLSFGGLIWLISAGDPAQLLQQGIGKGELMMFCAAASYALYSVLTKRWDINLPNWQSLYMQIAFGALLLLPNFLLAKNIQLNAQNIPLLLFAGIPASIIAPYLWILGVIRLGANKAAIFMNLMPVFTAVIAAIFLHEHLNDYHLIGGAITLAGVILAQRLGIPLSKKRALVTLNNVDKPD